MEISHVIRGEEWIPSTPKHLLIYQALGWQPTQFAHLPLIVNPDKTKLSKRQGDVSVEDFIQKGYLKEALINFVAFLGWNPKTEQEVFSMDELISQFDLAKINKSGAVFDIVKLDWINSLYIRGKNSAELVELLMPFWQKSGIAVDGFKEQYLEAIAALEKERLKKLSEIGERTGYYFKSPQYDAKLLVWKKSDVADAKQKLSELTALIEALDENLFDKENLETEIKNFIADKVYDNGSVLWPLRVALTGQQFSPGPFEVCATIAIGLGKQEIINRLKTAITKLGWIQPSNAKSD
jgi:glutamyl/glutaminyl-tRNA synthetase